MEVTCTHIDIHTCTHIPYFSGGVGTGVRRSLRKGVGGVRLSPRGGSARGSLVEKDVDDRAWVDRSTSRRGRPVGNTDIHRRHGKVDVQGLGSEGGLRLYK